MIMAGDPGHNQYQDKNNQGETVPLARPPDTRHEQPFPTNEARVSSQVLTEVVQKLPHCPVATLRPVTRGAAGAA